MTPAKPPNPERVLLGRVQVPDSVRSWRWSKYVTADGQVFASPRKAPSPGGARP